jgi:hypothetical protein
MTTRPSAPLLREQRRKLHAGTARRNGTPELHAGTARRNCTPEPHADGSDSPDAARPGRCAATPQPYNVVVRGIEHGTPAGLIGSTRPSTVGARSALTIIGAWLLIAASPVHAHKRFARRLGVECRECHEAVEGGGPRNVIGQFFQATGQLPIDRSESTMKRVHGVVDRWMLEQLATPPVIRFSRTPLAALSDLAPPPTTRAPDHAILRRMSLDLRGTSPTEEELAALLAGKPLAGFVDEFLDSREFRSTFLLYHRDLVRPRTGIFSTPPSFTKIERRLRPAGFVWTSPRIVDEVESGDCVGDRLVSVSPWWDRNTTLKVCARSASVTATVEVDGTTLDCGSEAGQKSGACGCGPHLVHCYVDGLRDQVIASMKEELPRQAMAIVEQDLPYSLVLTADWTMVDGALEVFYGKVWGTQTTLPDADLARPWHRVERDPRHAGALSSPAMLNFFYNGRRWAQRVLEVFACHETTPDFDLLDDTIDAGGSIAVPYRDSPDQPPSMTVTEGRACAACHLQLDAVARAKDRWDYFGRYTETMPNKKKTPIPHAVVFDGAVVDGLDGFGHALAGSETFHDCVAQQLWQHLLGHRFRPDEVRWRRAFVDDFRAQGLRFKALVKAIVLSDAYAAVENVKLMKREQYDAAMSRVTGVAWRVAQRLPASRKGTDDEVPAHDASFLDEIRELVLGRSSGWDVFYDKVGGMDYRRIEQRDIRPGIGHSLVQYKAAAESCAALVDADAAAGTTERLWLIDVGDVDAVPDAATLDAALAWLHRRALARPWDDVPDAERDVLRDLFRVVAQQSGVHAAWRATCTGLLASAEFALY